MVLAADQTGNGTYNAAPTVTTSFEVTVPPVPLAQTIAAFATISPVTLDAAPV